MVNEYCVTWKRFQSWLLESIIQGRKLVFLILWSALAILCMILFFTDHWLLYLLLGVFCIYRAVIRDFVVAKRQYAALAKTYGGENWTRTITISDTAVLIVEGNSSIQFPTTDIVEIKEKKDVIHLIFHNKMVIRLYSSAFIKGDWEACKKILN